MFRSFGGGSKTRVGVSSDYFSAARFAALTGLFLFAMFPGILLFGQSFVHRDFGLFGYPLAFYHRQCFWSGELPLWNPLNNCGLPFLAQWNTLTLYPGSLLYLLLPMPWSLSFFSLAHLFLAAMGMYFLARRWTGNSLAACVAGTAFAFNGFMLNCLMWPNYIASFGWMPWLVLATERAWREGKQWVIVAALVGSMQMLSGTPEIIALTWALIATIWAVEFFRNGDRRRQLALRFVIVVVLISGLSAAQLLPFSDLLKHSQRTSGFDAGSWSLPLWGLANFFVPLFRCYESAAGVYFQKEQGVTSSYYLGIGVLALAVLSLWRKRDRRTIALGLTAAICLIFALGDQGYVYFWVRKVLPFLGFMRYPIKFLMPVTFIVPLLAAMGVRDSMSSAAPPMENRNRKSVIIAAVFAVITLFVVWYSFNHPAEDENAAVTARNGLIRLIFLGGITAIIWAFPKTISRKRQHLLGLALLGFIWLDVETHAPPQNPVVKPEVFAPGLGPLHELHPQPAVGQSRAMLTLQAWKELHNKTLANPFEAYLCKRLGLYDNCNILDGIPKIDGFYALYLAEDEVRNALMTSEDFPTNVANFLSVSHVTAPGKVFDWEPRPDFLPMITGGQTPKFVSATNALAAVFASDFNPRQTVILPNEAKPLVSITNQSEVTISNSRWRHQQIDFDAEASSPALVVLSHAYYHPWKAYVDGTPTDILRANHAFQALQVSPGRHHVQLVYGDKMFYAGAAVSVATLVICLVALLRLKAGPRLS